MKIMSQICGKMCCNKLNGGHVVPSNNNKLVFWHNDGPDKETNSHSILMEWLTTSNNYIKWKGGDKHSGVTKNTHASVILSIIRSKGISVEQTPKMSLLRYHQWNIVSRKLLISWMEQVQG